LAGSAEQGDAYHEQAMQIVLPGPLVTSQAVQIEVMDALCERRVRALASRFWTESNGDPELVIIPLDQDLLVRAADLYQSRDDKDWSMTDCVSFEIMRQRTISDALTADHHFEQAGFRCLFSRA
jgi:predicted nucleic acid-binding protein